MSSTYDTGSWDSGFWDESSSGSNTLVMIRLRKRPTSRKFNDQRTQLQQAYDGMDGNAEFPSPSPTLAVLLAKLQAIDAKLTEISDAEAALRMKREERDILFNEAFLLYGQMASHVENVCGDNRAKAESSGFIVVDDVPATPTPLVAPTSVSATTGDNDGTMDVQWDTNQTADAYEVQSSPDPITGSSWVHAATVALSHVTLENLPGMAKRWARVRVVRGGEQGPWSDPACAVVT